MRIAFAGQGMDSKPASFNGRTSGFDPGDGGSSPSVGATFAGQGPKEQDRKGDYIETYTGKTFYVLDPREGEVDIDDISHALSNACRFSGHTSRFFSVAEHSCNTADYLLRRHANRNLALLGLFHDSSETYFVDIPRPIKPCLTNYKEIEEGIQTLIYGKFCKAPPNAAQYSLIKHADNVMLFAEAHNLMPSRGIGWQDYEKYIKEAQDVEIVGLNPEDAKRRFMLTYHSLLDITG